MHLLARAAIIQYARMLRVRAHIRDRGLVAILLVDARELAAVARLDALDVDSALALLAAVAARAVELAVVPNSPLAT